MGSRARFCQSKDGVKIAYSVSGEGPILVKAANWMSHMEYDQHSPLWRHWYEFFEERFTLIRYDQRGCGLSDRNVSTFDFESFVDDIDAVITDVQAEPVVIVGISQGAAIALAYAQRNPQKVCSLILYGSYLRGAIIRAATQQQKEEAELLVNLIELGWGRDTPDFRQVFTTQFIPDGNLEQLRALNELQRISTSPANAAKILNCLNHIDVSALADQINLPTLVLHARGDLRVPFEEGRRLAAAVPKAQFVPLESKNHILL
jgi:pimeloyl-ACP methyl ester carboxylesterase